MDSIPCRENEVLFFGSHHVENIISWFGHVENEMLRDTLVYLREDDINDSQKEERRRKAT